MRKLLIIGGTGFVGHHLANCFAQAGYKVSLLQRSPGPGIAHQQIMADRKDHVALRAALGDQAFDLVIDTCAFNEYDVEGAMVALKGRFDHWIHISSAGVYIPKPGHPRHEQDEIGGAPHWGDYGQDKSKAETAAIRTWQQIAPNSRLALIRPPYIYGPSNSSDRETFIWKRALRGLPVVVPKSDARIQFIAATDLARTLLALDQNPDLPQPCILNVGNPPPVSLIDFCRAAVTACGHPTKLVEVDHHTMNVAARAFFPFRDVDLWLDTDKLAGVIDPNGFMPLVDGLRQTFAQSDPHELRSALLDRSVEEVLLNQATQPD